MSQAPTYSDPFGHHKRQREPSSSPQPSSCTVKAKRQRFRSESDSSTDVGSQPSSPEVLASPVTLGSHAAPLPDSPDGEFIPDTPQLAPQARMGPSPMPDLQLSLAPSLGPLQTLTPPSSSSPAPESPADRVAVEPAPVPKPSSTSSASPNTSASLTHVEERSLAFLERGEVHFQVQMRRALFSIWKTCILSGTPGGYYTLAASRHQNSIEARLAFLETRFSAMETMVIGYLGDAVVDNSNNYDPTKPAAARLASLLAARGRLAHFVPAEEAAIGR